MTRRKQKDERNPRDYYQTPMWCIDKLLGLLGFMEGGFYGSVLDPGSGDGRIARSLGGLGIDIAPQSPDVLTADYLNYEWQGHWVIMNPPYTLAEQFVCKAISQASIGTIALLPWDWLCPVKRAYLRPYCRTVLHLGRVRFTGQSPMWNSAWFWFTDPRNHGLMTIQWES